MPTLEENRPFCSSLGENLRARAGKNLTIESQIIQLTKNAEGPELNEEKKNQKFAGSSGSHYDSVPAAPSGVIIRLPNI